jgi:hypothetical protein
MTEEPDWSQRDADRETVLAWMRIHAFDFADPEMLAFEAHEHFCRPFHILVLRRMAIEAFEETER